jgi:N-acetylglucosamine-6-phosphate deacetylase
MIVLSGADLVLPDRIIGGGSLVLDGGRILEVGHWPRSSGGAVHFDLPGHYIVPGFIDVHVHGVEGTDTLDGADAVGMIARRLPRYGVVAFCPTTIACAPAALRGVLAAVRQCRAHPAGASARVLPAHLESNFINSMFRGAQPADCLRLPPDGRRGAGAGEAAREYGGAEILTEIEAAAPDVGIVTLAPELPGALELVRRLVAAGQRVSLGHSGADFDQARAAIEAGARHATHLFNRMRPLHHRDPGLAGAVLESEEIAAEIICDAYHVHPAMVRAAVAAKHPSRVMAVTDGSAGAGLTPGSRVSLGGRPVVVRETATFLEDGTLAGSILTMDEAFRRLVTRMRFSPVQAALMCATTPARELGLHGHGVISDGAVADLTVLDPHFRVVQTYIDGVLVHTAL